MEKYKRNQVEEAVWRFISRDSAGRVPSTTFRMRLKKLLDFDRASDEASGYAFQDSRPLGRGNEAQFSAFNVFCLAFGMVLLNAGFKQQEVVALLQHIRYVLEGEVWHYLEENQSPYRQRVPTQDKPKLPSFEEDGIRYADMFVYVVVAHVEMVDPTTGKSSQGMLNPFLAYGADALIDHLRDNVWAHPGHFIVEINVMAERIKLFLEEAAPKRRGPGG